MPIMKGSAGAFDFLEDVGGLGGPDEGLGVLVVAVDVVIDGSDEFFQAAKHAATQAVVSQVTKEAFYHVQPRAAGGREMHVEARVAAEPWLHAGMFVSGVVVHDQVDLLAGRDQGGSFREAGVSR